MTAPKKGTFAFTGINRDQIEGISPPDWWTDGRNVHFSAGQTVRTPGEGRFAESGRLFPARFIHFVDTGSQNYFIYGGDAGVAVTDGVAHFDITPAGWGPIVSKNRAYTVGDINGVPFVNHPERGPFWWDADVTHDLVALPGWPAGWLCGVMRSHKNFLMAADIDSGAGLIEGQVSWSDSADPGQIPGTWAPSPTNDAGDYTFAVSTGPIIDMLSVRDQLLVAKQGYMGVLQYVGGQFVFQGRDVFPSVGLFAIGAWTESGNNIWMLTGTGDFVRHDMTSIQNVLYGVLQEYLRSQINYEYPSSVFVYRDDFEGQIGLAYPVGTSKACLEAITVEASSGRPGIRDLAGVYDATVGITAIAIETWDSDNRTWDSDTTTWNETASGYQPQKLVFAGDTRGMIEQDVGQQQIDAASGSLVDMVAFARRGGADIDMYGRRKTLSGMQVRVQGVAGDTLDFQFGGAETDTSSEELTPLLPYVIGIDDQIDFFLDGRLLSVLVQSTGGSQWRLTELHPDVRMSGRW